jgi:hypothetical protein
VWTTQLRSGCNAKQIPLIQDALAEQGEIAIFLHIKLLEWLECLNLLDKLPRALKALKTLTDVAGWSNIDIFGSRIIV